MTYVEELRQAVGDRPLLLAGTTLLAFDPDGQLLLHRRSDDNTWGLAGGLLEIGERPEDAVRREAREEVGLDVGEVRLFNVFAGEEFFHDYPGKGRVYGVNVVYVARDVRGEPRADQSEVREARFFPLDRLPEEMEQTTGLIVEAYLAEHGS